MRHTSIDPSSRIPLNLHIQDRSHRRLITLSSFDGVRIEPQEMRDAGDEVAVRLRGWFRGASSGVETEMSWAAVFTIRDGTIRRYRDYVGWPKALEAAGLLE